MRKKTYIAASTVFLLVSLLLTACGSSSSDSSQKNGPAGTGQQASGESQDMTSKQQGNEKILIAYFTLADNYKDAAKIDAVSQASLNLNNGELMGNTEYIAGFIRQNVGGELFSIQVEEPYPNDYDEVVDIGSEEQEKDTKPALATHVEHMEQYQTIYLGFPIWWYRMPQAVAAFLEEYDFSGKKIIPFATNGGYGVGNSVEDIEKLCPDAEVVTDIFEAEHDDDIPLQQDKVKRWLEGLGEKSGKQN